MPPTRTRSGARFVLASVGPDRTGMRLIGQRIDLYVALVPFDYSRSGNVALE